MLMEVDMLGNLRKVLLETSDINNNSKGHRNINDLETVCIYNENKMNKTLIKKYKEGKLLTSVPFKGKYYDSIFNVDMLIEGKLVLKEPLLNFIFGDKYFCKVTMVVKGGDYLIKVGAQKKTKAAIPSEVIKLEYYVPMGLASRCGQKFGGRSEINEFGIENMSDDIFLYFQNRDHTTFNILPFENKELDARELDIYSNSDIRPVVLQLIREYFEYNASKIEYSIEKIFE